MKKYFLFLFLILFVLADIFISNTIIVNNNINKSFNNSGYILKYTNDSERFYFSEESTYKESYGEQIVFKDTQGEKVVVDKSNFIHYDDGSISSFTKGVLIDLDMIETEPITYYNISAGKVLKKLSNNKYVTKNLNNEIQFTNLMWKISDSKYLVASNSMQIVFADGTEKEINGFIEIEYCDNEIVRMYNQEVEYETISSDLYLKVNDTIKINLGTKIVSKDDKNEMTLENMVIDSNDNVTIIDMEEYKESEESENQNTINDVHSGSSTGTGDSTIQGGNAGSVSGGNVTVNGGSTIIEGDNNNINEGEDDYTGELENIVGDDSVSGDVETEITDDLTVNAPKYTIKEFEVTSTGLKALVEITDDEARLTTGTISSIIDNKTGKAVYTLPETGATEIKIDTSSLEANTEYTLVMEASYAVEEVEYKKNFVYKIFRTPVLGIILEKDLFTDESLSFNIKFEKDSPVTKLDVELLENGQKREGIVNAGGSTEKIQFAELTPDTQYTLQIKNIYVDNTSNDNTYSYTYKTLKSTPKLANGKTHSDVKVEIDKWNSKFVLSIPDLEEGLVETLNYQIFTQTEGKETLVYNKITTNTELILAINDTIQRNKEYYCRVYATFYDNEKVVEYEIANTETSFIMNSSEMPTIRFETENDDSITFNSIKGNIIIEDEGNTIDEKTAKIEVIYSSTTKGVDDTGTLTYTGIGEELSIPIDLKELKSNETYKFSVYATYNLHDDNGERYGFIGSVMVTTDKPIAMKANWTPAQQGININLRLTSTENSDLEAESLYSFDLALYLGQEGASNEPVAKAKLVDSGVESFAASLKDTYYTNSGAMITKDTFGLTDAQVEQIEKENNYCTIVLTNAKDYVSRNETKNFENDLPIISNSMSYQITMSELKNPTSSSDAIKNTSVTKKKLKSMTSAELNNYTIIKTDDYNSVGEITSNNKINGSTVVAYEMVANISTAQLDRFNYFEYLIYDGSGNIVAESGMIKKSEEATETPGALFLISNGTSDKIDDECLARGNRYYLVYYAYENENKDGKYPADENGADYWQSQGKPSINTLKQQPNIIMYPSTSDQDSITYKYKISDIDNAITQESGGKKYFYHFYADVAVYEGNKKEIQEGENPSDENGYWTVKFDNLSRYYTNYNLEVRILQSTSKSVQAAYRTLTIQKLEEIAEEPNITANIENKTGISSIITFNNLSSTYRSQIEKIKIELVDTEKEIPTIEIEKEAAELNSSNWIIEINYLDIIYKEATSIKNKNFDVNIKLYYANGIAGYDNNGDAVTYQTSTGEPLRIYTNNQEFAKVVNEDGTMGYPIVYEGHEYIFDDNKVIIKQNGEEISWLNYSSEGFKRTIDSEDVIIIPKKVKAYDIKNVGQIKIENVIPGIKSSQDLEVTPRPANATIVLKNIYSKDTIADEKQILIDIYDYQTDEIIVSKLEMDMTDGVTIENLVRGNEYYYKLYIENDGVKYYLYDMDRKTNNTQYEFSTLDEVKVTGLSISYEKRAADDKRLVITHGASISRGYKGFVYEIYDANGNLVKERISYSIDNTNYETISNGSFIVNLEDFEEPGANFGVIYINANRNTFFEYNTKYTIKVTPIIEVEDGKSENIGNTISENYSYSPIIPETIVYARRVENTEGDPYIEFSISISDDDYLVTNENLTYKIYKNGDLIPCKQGELPASDYTTIRLSKEIIGDNFDFGNLYKIEVTYKYYTSNKDDNKKETVSITKEISQIQNGTYMGTINWAIVDNTQIKLKFYDSYELSNVKAIKCSIYDVNGRILKNVPTVENISIIDQTADEVDPHKSITFDPEYTFEIGKAYIISIRFLDKDGNEISSFEPEGPITNN